MTVNVGRLTGTSPQQTRLAGQIEELRGLVQEANTVLEALRTERKLAADLTERLPDAVNAQIATAVREGLEAYAAKVDLAVDDVVKAIQRYVTRNGVTP